MAPPTAQSHRGWGKAWNWRKNAPLLLFFLLGTCQVAASPSDLLSPNPTKRPTLAPSGLPSASTLPTALPTLTAPPTLSVLPSVLPTLSPSPLPTLSPSGAPSFLPTTEEEEGIHTS